MRPYRATFRERLDSLLQCYRMRKRVRRTVSDRSADAVPKVNMAGEVVLVNGHKAQVMHNGVLVTYGGYHGHWMAKIIHQLRGHHEPYEEVLFYHVLRSLPKQARMLEVGSYWAYYSLWFKKSSSMRECYLIEPNPIKIEVGKKNFLLNDLEGKFLQYFISSKDGMVGFEDDSGTKLNIPSITIDRFMQEENLDHLDILHADIQGAETEMLEGARDCLDKLKIDFLFISTHDDKHDKCLEILSSAQYRILAHHSVEESSSADGLILAVSPKVPSVPQIPPLIVTS